MNHTIFYLVTFAIVLSPNVFGQISVQSIVFDSSKGYFAVEYINNDSSSVMQGTIKTNNNVSPIVIATVSRVDTFTFKYSYSVTNKLDAVDPLYEIGIKLSLPISNIEKPNNHWDGFYLNRNKEVNWAKIGSSVAGIPPDSTLIGFSFRSAQIPSITESYSRNYTWYSFPDEIEGPFGKLENLIDSVFSLSNGVKDITLGVWNPDSLLEAESFTDTLETFRFRSCEELGWANDTTVCGQFEDQLSEVKAALQNQDSVQSANLLAEFIALVEQEKETSLTSEGYALLFFNAEYLAERLRGED